MKTLLYVTLSYPPQGVISAIRAARLVHHLESWGWRSVVVAASRIHGIPDDTTIPDTAWRVIRVPCPDPFFLKGFIAPAKGGGTVIGGNGLNSFWRRLANSIMPLTVNRMPSRFIAWLPIALIAIARSGVVPDAIFTSCSPPVDAIIGAVCKRAWKVPWIVEFRDLWSHNPIERLLPPFEIIDEAIERRVVAGADKIATVSEELAEDLRRMHSKPVFVLENGHEHHVPPKTQQARPKHDGVIEIAHGGSLYGGRRDPTPLLEALRIAKNRGIVVRATFVGPDAAAVVEPIATSLGIGELVSCRGWMPHDDWLVLASRADALVILEETTREAAGNATGKLFEYVGMRKPVIAVAAPQGAIDRVLRRTGLGRASQRAEDVAEGLVAIAKGTTPHPVEAEIQALSWHALAGRLARELDALTRSS